MNDARQNAWEVKPHALQAAKVERIIQTWLKNKNNFQIDFYAAATMYPIRS